MHTTRFGSVEKRGAVTVILGLVLAFGATAQEPGEPVELAIPAPMGSLKIVPSNQELFDLLNNPYAPPVRRRSFLFDINGVERVLAPLLVHPLDINPLTGLELLLNAEGEISFDIPAQGTPAVDPNTGQLNGVLELPENEMEFIADRTAATRLGKALFWDMQVGSDGVQSCGTCHFHAGVDNRIRNQLNPNTLRLPSPDHTLQVKGPNQAVTPADFPFHKLLNRSIPGEPLLNPGNVASDANDVMSSMGVRFRKFDDVLVGLAAFTAPHPANFGVNALLPDLATEVPDPVEAFLGLRRVEPRNTPTMFAAAFNFDNFWDGRARHDFNGGSPFGASDPHPHIFVEGSGGLEAVRELIRMSSVASLATGPPLSDFEMSFQGRNWAKLAKKLLQPGVVPLANQLVHINDSILGPLSNQNETPGKPGLNVDYPTLIRMAFEEELWENETHHLKIVSATDPFDNAVLGVFDGAADPMDTAQFSQMEGNFSLIFGLAVQAFVQILLPDDTGFDRFMDANPNEFLGAGSVPDIDPNTAGVQVEGLTERQLHGFDLFQGQNHSGRNPFFKTARCAQCHNGPEMTDHSVSANHALILGDFNTGKPKVISGFLLAEESGENAQDAVEVDNVSFGLDFTTMLPTFGQDNRGFPTGHGLLDNGVYNIGVRPILEDVSRGGDDPFGFPLSLATLALMNIGAPVGSFGLDPTTTITQLTAIDAEGNEIPAGLDISFTPHLPDHLAPYANELPVGEAWPLIDQTIFQPDMISSTIAVGVTPSASYPNPNRVGKMGNFKAPSLRNVELSGPYFHTGSYLTLRQVVDFYSRGGDFPASNTEHRDPHILNLSENFFSELTEAEKDALVDFLIALTDERVRYEKAPFDHPEVFVPINGTAPDNLGGRAWFLSDARFLRIPEVGSEGRTDPLPNFLNVSSVQEPAGQNNVLDHFDSVTAFGLPNTAPTAADDEYTVIATALGTVAAPGVLENDNDPEGNTITAILISGPTDANGTLALSPNGSFTYRYGVNVVSAVEDSFTYKINDGTVDGNTATVTLTVEPRTSNVAPIATIDAYAATATLALNIAAPGVLGNDSDADGDQLTAVLVSSPSANATLMLNPDGSFTYTYTLDVATPFIDTFTYKPNDGLADGNVATVTITVNPRVITLPEALDTPSFVWRTGGTSNWFGQSLVTHDGVDAARSGMIGHSRETWLETTVTGPGTFSFWWKVSSESGNDRLRLYVNGSSQSGFSISGEVDWQFRTINLSSGTKIVRFRYDKNSSTIRGQDRAWVDQVTFTPPTPPSITGQPVGQTVGEGTTVSFSVTATGTAPLTYRWRRNGVNLSSGGNIGGATSPTLILTRVQARQAGVYSVLVTGTASVPSSGATLTIDPTLAAAVDAPTLVWTAGGTAGFLAQTAISFDGTDAAQSGAIGHSQESWLQTTVTGPGVLTFRWKVESEAGNDALRFILGSTEQFSISGNIDWQLRTVNVPAGTFNLRWRYNKNGSVTVGADRGWLDQVQFAPAPPTITQQPAGRSVASGANVNFGVTATGGSPLSFQWLFEGNPLSNGPGISGATTAVLQLTGVQPLNAGNYSVVVNNPSGPVTSANALLTVAPPLPLADAVDAPNRIFRTEGDANWTRQTTVSFDGVDAARSGVIDDEEETILYTTVTGPGTVSFRWKVSSEQGSDELQFHIDGEEVGVISGEVDWQFVTFAVPSGSQMDLEWIYTKDGDGAAGQDAAWVDQVQFTPAP